MLAGGAGAALQWTAVLPVAALDGGEQTAMSPQSEEFSLRRARLLTLLVLVGIAAWIALANLSTELMTDDFLVDAMRPTSRRPRGLSGAVIYILADSFISLHERAFESAPHREILRENTWFAPRRGLAGAPKTGPFMPDHRRFGARFDAYR